MGEADTLRSEEALADFLSRFEGGFDEFIENLEFFVDEVPMPLSPESFDMDDERAFHDLNPKEMKAAARMIHQKLGVDTQDPDMLVRQYRSPSSPDPEAPGDSLVRVFRTNIDDMVLQEMNFRDETFQFMIGPDIDV